ARSNGKYTASDLTWHLPCEQLSKRPGLGDVITDAGGQRWTVLDVRAATLQSRWQCSTRNLAVVYALDDTVTVLKAVYAKGDGGAASATWRPWRTGIRARIQPLETGMGVRHASRQAANQYTIFIEEDLSLDHTHRIKAADGTIYKITNIEGTQRIGKLPAIQAEEA
ncbi:MAG: head-tail adaptor protein, partial [Thermoguttaceae bacterium]